MTEPKVEENWTCETCNQELENRQAVVEHLRTHHGETSDNPKGKRSMLSHIDGRDWYGGSYRWEFDCGAVMTNSYRAERDKNDPMRIIAAD
jgi:hypothetical protein